MRSLMSAAVAATVLLVGSSGAFAQRVGVEIYADEPYYEYREPASRPNRYYYRSDEDRPVVVIPLRPANCGVYRYWNGDRCVDARVVPPDIR